ncbi:MAG: biopolymer transporter ExbD [Candidatus Wallbacteria bacterium]|nr:biopolymer transporter ExbD [Candidatus Wallbacteria bacterium]
MKRLSYLDRHPLLTMYLTPLIDVLLVLIIFLVLSTSFAKFNYLDIVPPAAAEKRDQISGPPQKLVELGADGSILVDKQPASLEDLKTIPLPDDTVTLAVDRKCRFNDFARVFDVLSYRNPKINLVYNLE